MYAKPSTLFPPNVVNPLIEVSLSLFLVCLSFFLSLSHSRLSVYMSFISLLSFPLSFSFLSICFSTSLYHYLSPFCVYVLFISLSLSLFYHISLCKSIYLSISLYLIFSASFTSFSVVLSLCISFSFSLSLSSSSSPYLCQCLCQICVTVA